jgi:myo-inositol-1(or 4)-monophosphatase
MQDFERIVAAGTEAALRAGALLMEKVRSGFKVAHKGETDLVTEADIASEQLIVSRLRNDFPDHAILAEENHSKAKRGQYTWIIDPLDGTTNFIHRYPFFATSVAVRAEGELQAGAVYDPVRDEMFAAARGRGATLNGSPIRVSGCRDLSGALLVTGFPFRSLSALPRFLDSLDRLIRASTGVRRDGSAALDCCYVACGRYDGFWECALSAWDIAAGALIIREAGGLVTDFDGADGFLESGDIVASSPGMHPSFLGEVRKAFRP